MSPSRKHAPQYALFALAVFSVLPGRAWAQAASQPQPSPSSSTPAPKLDYPRDKAGILIIYDTGWHEISAQGPTKSHLKHALAPGLTYGAVPAVMLTDYDGLHAQTQIAPGRPLLCVCHFIALTGAPALVRLHPKKDHRELDGGNIHIGVKLEEAKKSLVDVSVTSPESEVWLVQPHDDLPEGEYGLMIGSQNLIIFPFSVINEKKDYDEKKADDAAEDPDEKKYDDSYPQ
jgi:hypothetical protein